jgi:hypothetical protein
LLEVIFPNDPVAMATLEDLLQTTFFKDQPVIKAPQLTLDKKLSSLLRTAREHFKQLMSPAPSTSTSDLLASQSTLVEKQETTPGQPKGICFV